MTPTAIKVPHSNFERLPAHTRDEGIGDLVGQSISDAKHFVGAQVDLYKQQAAFLGASLKMPAILGVVALLLGIGALMLLLIALVLALAPLIGEAWAALAVAVLAAALAGLLVYIAASQGSAAFKELGKSA